MKKPRTTNPELLKLIHALQKQSHTNEVKVWRSVADYLTTSKRRRVRVNLSRLNRHTENGETVIVPGKVLGAGALGHSINVAALAFSNLARSKIIRAKGTCLSIPDVMNADPKGSNLKVIR